MKTLTLLHSNLRRKCTKKDNFKLNVFLTGCAVAIVTYCSTNMLKDKLSADNKSFSVALKAVVT